MSQPTRRPPARPRSSFSTIGGLMAVVFTCGVLFAFHRDPEATAGLALGLLVTIGLLYPWVMGPIRLRRGHWSSLEAAHEPFDPQADDIPPRVIEAIREVVPTLEGLGFEGRGHFRLTGAVPGLLSYITLFENRRTLQTARCLTTLAPGSRTAHRQGVTILLFFTEFTDGTRMTTGNNATLPLQPSSGLREGSMAFPWIRDPALLYEVHEASIARYASDGVRFATNLADPAEYLRNFRREETRKHAERGYYFLDDAGRVYRPTWKGAILISWKVRRPVLTIRRMIRHRQARRILREIGLERLSPGSPELPARPAPVPAQ